MEQAFALLVELEDLTPDDFAPLARDLALHLAVEEQLLYPIARQRLGGVEWPERQLVRVKAAAIVAAQHLGSREALRNSLCELQELFAEHAHMDELMVHPLLEGAMSCAALEGLSVRARALRAALAEYGAVAEPGRPAGIEAPDPMVQ